MRNDDLYSGRVGAESRYMKGEELLLRAGKGWGTVIVRGGWGQDGGTRY